MLALWRRVVAGELRAVRAIVSWRGGHPDGSTRQTRAATARSRNPASASTLAQTRGGAEARLVICAYCKQDVDQPCPDLHEMRRRAMNHVERCERALRDELADEIDPSDGQSAGSV